jgi:hypothetical protein
MKPFVSSLLKVFPVAVLALCAPPNRANVAKVTHGDEVQCLEKAYGHTKTGTAEREKASIVAAQCSTSVSQLQSEYYALLPVQEQDVSIGGRSTRLQKLIDFGKKFFDFPDTLSFLLDENFADKIGELKANPYLEAGPRALLNDLDYSVFNLSDALVAFGYLQSQSQPINAWELDHASQDVAQSMTVLTDWWLAQVGKARKIDDGILFEALGMTRRVLDISLIKMDCVVDQLQSAKQAPVPNYSVLDSYHGKPGRLAEVVALIKERLGPDRHDVPALVANMNGASVTEGITKKIAGRGLFILPANAGEKAKAVRARKQTLPASNKMRRNFGSSKILSLQRGPSRRGVKSGKAGQQAGGSSGYVFQKHFALR